MNIYYAGKLAECSRRYREFFELNQRIQEKFPLRKGSSKFPPKVSFLVQRDQVVTDRMKMLNACLVEWTQDRQILESGILHKFLGLPIPKHTPKPRKRSSHERKYRVGRMRKSPDMLIERGSTLSSLHSRNSFSGDQSMTVSLPIGGKDRDWKFVKPKTPPCLQKQSPHLRATSHTSTLCTVPEDQSDPYNTITNLMKETSMTTMMSPPHPAGQLDFESPQGRISRAGTSSSKDGNWKMEEHSHEVAGNVC
eukprot:CAMPEP_0114493882 /NCGR_PEP_ID=MMETSP0109-20121206/4348_1 /TAXON_ID=29199 /ORGANISM="Chlorarachnion reptans, Strain CCCM449" /LENGTH=250 /DNA_ID=CAMNT_0001670867 /DNA_START=164 /DNA_END=916 /DNA_ORIENTATION=-